MAKSFARLTFVAMSLASLVVVTNKAVLSAEEASSQLQTEVAAARDSLQEHPKFQKYYEHLAATPDSLPVNGPKLALLLAAEAKTSAAIKDHTPSLLATWQEVVRLASAGNDYKTAFPAIDSLQKHASGLLTPAAARLAKGKLLAAVAEANAIKPVPGEREALLELVRPLLKESFSANDVAALPSLLAADTKLSWSTTESANSIQLLLPLAQQAVEENRIAVGKLLFDHLATLVLKTAAGKPRKDFADAIAAARERLTIVEGAQQAQQTLATKPLDPAANQAYGMYLLACGQAKESLTYLALGTDLEWRKLAAEGLEVKTATEKAALADRWAATAKDFGEGGRPIARLFYEEALADKALVGIPRAAAEEKLKELGPATATVKRTIASTGNKPLPVNEWTDVLPLIDIDQDLVRGHWARGPQDSLLCAKTPSPKLRLPVVLTNSSYDLIVEFNLLEGNSDVYLLLPIADRMTWLLVDSWTNNDRCWFKSIRNGPIAHRNLLHAKQAHRYEVSVRLQGDQAHATFAVNGDKIIEYKGPVSAVESPDEDSIGTVAQPGLAAYLGTVQFTKVQVRVIDGPAKIGRDVPLLKPISAEILALKATRLTSLRPITARAHSNHLAVSAVPAGTGAKAPLLSGKECTDYLFAHAPSSLSYAIPAKAKYFTAVAHCTVQTSVKFTVKADGKELYSVENQPISIISVEIPEGAKVLQLECDPLGDVRGDHSSWCFPAFRQ
ncbi:NPCBM/NEW2 domain-containing protein [Anatilimnocola sp. NA78]|uniref:NPCBM/NEW2 domain-containing protein n=1 Tax=Anatilimnocola sp. NA78 TaxID=3415683 RepID=UPI003CE4FB62